MSSGGGVQREAIDPGVAVVELVEQHLAIGVGEAELGMSAERASLPSPPHAAAPMPIRTMAPRIDAITLTTSL